MDYNRGPSNKSSERQASNLDKGVKSLHREKNTILTSTWCWGKFGFYELTNEGRYVSILLHKNLLKMEQDL